ncbi:MAG: discoidin domain-containing protein [Bacteroidota bacterium]
MKKIIFLALALMTGLLMHAQYASMAIVGNGVGGWPTGAAGEVDAKQMSSIDGINWSLDNIVTTSGAVKFRAVNSWTNNWGAAAGSFPAGTAVLNGSNITVPVGVWNVTFNSTTLAFSFTASSLYPTISLAGEGVNNTDIDLGTSDGIHYTGSVAINGAVRFRKNHADTNTWNPPIFPSGTAVAGAGTLNVANNTYNVTFNLTTLQYAFNYPTIALVGNSTPQGWPTDPQVDTHVLSTTDGIHYVINTITLTSGAVKFRQDNGWTVQWGGDGGFPNGTGSQGGIDINIPAGTYSITLNRTTGAYSFGVPIGAAPAPDCTLVNAVTANATSGTAILAADGNSSTRWESAATDAQSLTLDLGTVTTVSAVSIAWDTYSAKDYVIKGSVDGTTWVTIAEKNNMAYGARIDVTEGINAQYRYVKMDGLTRTTQYGYAIYEFSVCGTPIEPDTAKKILFIGNSYTYYNNLPTMVKNVAASVGDELKAYSYTVGGTSLEEHFASAGTTGALQLGGWDYVVLQEHSQRPALEEAYVAEHTFAYAAQLADMAREYSPCTELFFYQTWGRKNGDATYCPTIPEMCTYEGMDDRLKESYAQMADDNNATISPVGSVRRQIRLLHPEIELYTDDESHPTLAGTYVSAITFYTVLFRKDPTLVTYNTSILTATVANQIKAVVKSVVYDNLAQWNVGAYDPAAAFTFEAAGNTVSFTNTSENALEYDWNFGDGTTSAEQNPEHLFTGNGPYSVTLTVTNCSRQSVSTQDITLLGLNQYGLNTVTAYPNPTGSTWNITTTNTAINTINVMDMTGKTVMTLSPKSNTALIDAAALSTGIYLAKITVGDAVQTVKLVKN